MIRIGTSPNGETVLTKPNADGRSVNLVVANLFIRASDGRCFTSAPIRHGVSTLSPDEVAMAVHWFEKRGMPTPDVFAGDPA